MWASAVVGAGGGGGEGSTFVHTTTLLHLLASLHRRVQPRTADGGGVLVAAVSEE